MCPNEPVQLQASGGVNFRWEPIDGLSDPNIFNPFANPDTTTTYSVIVENNNGCFDTANVTVTVRIPPTATVTPDTTICAGSSVQLEASGGINFEWSPAATLSNPAIPNPIASPLETTTYQVVVQNEEGCRDTAQVIVTVITADLTLSMPDTTGDPRTKDYRIPINYSLSPETVQCVPDSLSLTISFNSTLFFPKSVDGGTITSNEITGGQRVITISLDGTALTNPNGVLATLVGDVLLGNALSTPLNIDSVDYGNLLVNPTLVNGSLTLDSVCMQGGARLLSLANSAKIRWIVPNPSGTSTAQPIVQVETSERVETFLEVYTQDGTRLHSFAWTPERERDERGGVIRDIALPNDLPSGIYLVVLRTASSHDATTFIIAR
jgi:hypothetical protein